VKATEETIENISFYYCFQDYENTSKRVKKISIKVRNSDIHLISKFLSLIDKQNFAVYKVVFEEGKASQVVAPAQTPNPLGMGAANPKVIRILFVSKLSGYDDDDESFGNDYGPRKASSNAAIDGPTSSTETTRRAESCHNARNDRQVYDGNGSEALFVDRKKV
jgi:hypothetical protein